MKLPARLRHAVSSSGLCSVAAIIITPPRTLDARTIDYNDYTRTGGRLNTDGWTATHQAAASVDSDRLS